ncbi:MAG TPA: hypothetical protein DCM87_20820 [Planctomycetes bacterium]|nr:hypothetical protein [Planctomycetota bacterium]
MHMRRDFLVGAMFLGAIIAVGYLTVVIKGFSALVGPSLPPLTITFPEIAGLDEGEEVRAKGVKVGQVDAVDYRDDGTVAVRIVCFANPHLRRDCSFHIRSKSPLGGKYLEIDPGAAKEPAEGAAFAGERPSDLFTDLGTVVAENREAIAGTLDNLNHTTRALRDGKGILGALVYDTRLRDNALRIVADLRASVAGEKENLLAAILSDADLARNVKASVAELKDSLARRDTPLGVILHDEDAGKDLRRIVGDAAALARGVREGQGTLGRFFTDDTLYRTAVDAAGSVAAITKGDGAVAYLLTDPASRVQIKDIVASLRGTLGDISQGKGTLGRLITDVEMYEQLRALIVQIREAVEDAREHAPVNQLVNMVGAVF